MSHDIGVGIQSSNRWKEQRVHRREGTEVVGSGKGRQERPPGEEE